MAHRVLLVLPSDKTLTDARPDKWGFLLRKKMAPAGKPEMRWRDRVRLMRSGAPMSQVLSDSPRGPEHEAPAGETFITATVTSQEASFDSSSFALGPNEVYQPPSQNERRRVAGPTRPFTAKARPGSAMPQREGARPVGRPQTALPTRSSRCHAERTSWR